jgi:hypothetical protein
MPDHAIEPRRDVPVRLGKVWRLPRQDRAHRVGGRLAVERAVTREHLVEDRAEGEDVASRVGRLSPHLLRRHVAERAEHDARLGARRGGRQIRLLAPAFLGVRQFRQTEVEDLEPAILRDEEVLGLQVPVDNPLLVGRCEAVRNLHRIVDRLALRESAVRKPQAQRLTLEQLGNDVGRAFEGADVVDRQDVRVVERPGRLRLLLEAAQPLRIAREGGRQDLDRHVPLQPLVPRAVHLAHPAGAERGEDLVGAELRPSCQGHRLGKESSR